MLQERVAVQVRRSSSLWPLGAAALALVVIEIWCAHLRVRGPVQSLLHSYSREEPAAPAFYCALALALVLVPVRLRWPTLGAAVVVDLGFAVERLIAHGAVRSFGNGALVALTVLTGYVLLRVRGSARSDALKGLACAWAFVAATTVGDVWLRITARSRPQVLDEYVAHADRALGYPSWVVGRAFAVLGTPGQLPFLAVYSMLPVAAVVVAVVQLRRGWVSHNVVVTFVVVGMLGPLIYLLFPVVGPAFAFGTDGRSFAISTQWPSQVPALPHLRPVDFDAVTPRNCVPSLHTAWAVVLFLHTRRMGRWLGGLGAAWLVVTLAATLGFGYHYGFDLVVGAVFGLTVEAGVRARVLGWQRDHLVFVAAGAALFVVLLALVRFGANTLAVHPLVTAVAVLGALGVLGSGYWWVFRDDRAALAR